MFAYIRIYTFYLFIYLNSYLFYFIYYLRFYIHINYRYLHLLQVLSNTLLWANFQCTLHSGIGELASSLPLLVNFLLLGSSRKQRNNTLLVNTKISFYLYSLFILLIFITHFLKIYFRLYAWYCFDCLSCYLCGVIDNSDC